MVELWEQKQKEPQKWPKMTWKFIPWEGVSVQESHSWSPLRAQPEDCLDRDVPGRPRGLASNISGGWWAQHQSSDILGLAGRRLCLGGHEAHGCHRFGSLTVGITCSWCERAGLKDSCSFRQPASRAGPTRWWVDTWIILPDWCGQKKTAIESPVEWTLSPQWPPWGYFRAG